MKYKEVEFTKDQARELIIEYNRAVNSDTREFTYDGREYVRAYAYYIIQWWDMKGFIKGAFDHNKRFLINE